MSRVILSILIILYVSFFCKAQTKTSKPFSIGKIETLKSTILKENIIPVQKVAVILIFADKPTFKLAL